MGTHFQNQAMPAMKTLGQQRKTMAVAGWMGGWKVKSPRWPVFGAALLTLCFSEYTMHQFIGLQTLEDADAPHPRTANDGAIQSPPSKDWRAALRVMAAAAASRDTEMADNDKFQTADEKDVVMFPSFIDAYRFAPQATFGAIMATCTKAFENEEVPSDGTSSVEYRRTSGQAASQSYEQQLRSRGAPSLLMNDLSKQFRGDRGEGTNATANSKQQTANSNRGTR